MLSANQIRPVVETWKSRLGASAPSMMVSVPVGPALPTAGAAWPAAADVGTATGTVVGAVVGAAAAGFAASADFDASAGWAGSAGLAGALGACGAQATARPIIARAPMPICKNSRRE